MKIVEAREVPVGERCLWCGGDEFRRIEGTGPDGWPLFNWVDDDGSLITMDDDASTPMIVALDGNALVHLFDVAEAA